MACLCCSGPPASSSIVGAMSTMLDGALNTVPSCNSSVELEVQGVPAQRDALLHATTSGVGTLRDSERCRGVLWVQPRTLRLGLVRENSAAQVNSAQERCKSLLRLR